MRQVFRLPSTIHHESRNHDLQIVYLRSAGPLCPTGSVGRTKGHSQVHTGRPLAVSPTCTSDQYTYTGEQAMKQKPYTLLDEPTGQTYRDLLRYSLSFS